MFTHLGLSKSILSKYSIIAQIDPCVNQGIPICGGNTTPGVPAVWRKSHGECGENTTNPKTLRRGRALNLWLTNGKTGVILYT